MPDELKILIEGLRDDIKLVAEGVDTINAKFDRHVEENRKDHEEFRQSSLHVEADVSTLKKDVSEIRSDLSDQKKNISEIRSELNDHRTNTEHHAKKKVKAS